MLGAGLVKLHVVHVGPLGLGLQPSPRALGWRSEDRLHLFRGENMLQDRLVMALAGAGLDGDMVGEEARGHELRYRHLCQLRVGQWLLRSSNRRTLEQYFLVSIA